MNKPEIKPVVPSEGWHAMHLFYKVEHGSWALLSDEDRLRARTQLNELVEEIRGDGESQLMLFVMATPKADIGFMLLTPDLQVATAYEKRITLALGADILTPVFSWLSLTEEGEYMTSDEEFSATLEKDENLTPGTPGHDKRMGEFRARMTKHRKDKLTPQFFPNITDWPVFCFYPMSKRRWEKDNWYALPFAERKRLMAGHARIGRQWHGRILQLVTGSTGLDDMEWGVTLFAHDTFDVKGAVYAMRFDEASARFADFGEFYIGLQLPLDEIFKRLQV